MFASHLNKLPTNNPCAQCGNPIKAAIGWKPITTIGFISFAIAWLAIIVSRAWQFTIRNWNGSPLDSGGACLEVGMADQELLRDAG